MLVDTYVLQTCYEYDWFILLKHALYIYTVKLYLKWINFRTVYEGKEKNKWGIFACRRINL